MRFCDIGRLRSLFQDQEHDSIQKVDGRILSETSGNFVIILVATKQRAILVRWGEAS
jgi:hypothetical protein